MTGAVLVTPSWLRKGGWGPAKFSAHASAIPPLVHGGLGPIRSASRAGITCHHTLASLGPTCLLGVPTVFKFISSPCLCPAFWWTCLQDPLASAPSKSPLRSFVTSSACTHIAFRLWVFIALSPGCGAEHDMQGLASGDRAFGSSLAFGPHIRVLTAEATPRLLVAVTAQSRISNPFPQGKHLLIML